MSYLLAFVPCGVNQIIASFLTSLNRRAENIIIEAVVISELKFSDVEWHVLGTNLVERTDDAALEDAPEAFNRLSVDSADNVLPLGMVNGRVRITVPENGQP